MRSINGLPLCAGNILSIVVRSFVLNFQFNKLDLSLVGPWFCFIAAIGQNSPPTVEQIECGSRDT